MRGRGLLPVLQRDLQRDLDRRRAVIRKEDVPQSMRREIDQPLGQPDRRGVRHAQRGDVGDLVQLLPDCRIDLGPPMSVDVAPEAADSIQVAAALHIDQPVPLAPFDDPGLVFRHLREAVPDMLPVPLPQLVDAGIHAAHREIGIEEDRKMRAAAGRRSERGPRPLLQVTYHRIVTGLPGRMPRKALTLSPTSCSLTKPSSPSTARNVICGC